VAVDVAVEAVTCHARGVDVRLRERLPAPRGGMWALELENFPQCPGVTRQDVGGGHAFTVLFADKQWCGVEPVSWFVSVPGEPLLPPLTPRASQTPNWVSYAEMTLVLSDANGTKVADSVSCIYNTRFDSSLLTFKGEAMR